MNGLEVKWVRLAWSKSDPKNDLKNADGPTGTAGTGPAITAGTPRATGNIGGKDRRRYGWHIGELDAVQAVSHEEAASWLKSWGTAVEKNAPR